MSVQIIFLVPFECKDDAKALGARWDPTKKSWYMMTDNANIERMVDTYPIMTSIDKCESSIPSELYRRMLAQMLTKSSTPIDLDIPYENKDEVKRLGARWDDAGKVWFTYANHPNLTKMQALERKAAPRQVLKFIKHPAGFVAPTVDGND